MPQLKIKSLTFDLHPAGGETFRLVAGGRIWAIEENLSLEELKDISKFFHKHGTEDEARPDSKLIEQIVDAGVRQVSKVFHPDAGGSEQAMTELNLAAEWLRGQVKEL